MSTHLSHTPIPITDAIRETGSVTALARRLNCSRQAIYDWIKAGQPLPELYRYRFLYAHKKAPKMAGSYQRGLDASKRD
jgi:predicted DNA-binding protein YlxM (UPF0122 family)